MKDRDPLLAFFDFPAEHWVTSNRAHERRAFAEKAKLMVFKLVMAASKTWCRVKVKAQNQLPKVIAGVRFNNGIEEIKSSDHRAA